MTIPGFMKFSNNSSFQQMKLFVSSVTIKSILDAYYVNLFRIEFFNYKTFKNKYLFVKTGSNFRNKNGLNNTLSDAKGVA